ncbi:ABC transporter ATP-binding protein [Candidatus Velamenicoccus archaeovorus]|uniref:ABC transporter ATP-binding protein n=1 Tax=Velamenicoccus archaeovorus TaxID=1930593 RepID=A0A410P3H3_VELA1|nr:ATP-binding cassette domain-containing protein [Candidatus Velamenicoccus archaeovorus]QAT16641.1 ABC transporter ATP-binding protein [Candidatus Velamenicoccus archaeovorus]
MDNSLKIENLTVEVGGRVILEDLNLEISPGSTLVLFGPNGSGKSTLIKAIMGFENYAITHGKIVFGGEVINGLSTDERAKKGIGVLFQNPPKIRGIKLRQMVELVTRRPAQEDIFVDKLNVGELMDRDLNVNFSGGEMKRSELLQVLSQRPKLLLLDEPESGVDIENIAMMGRVLNAFIREHAVASLIITHTGYVLDYVDAQHACVLMDRDIRCYDDPRKVFEDIRQFGYEKCRTCRGQ